MAKEFTFNLRRDTDALTVGGLIELLKDVVGSLEKLDPDLPAPWEVVRVTAPSPLTFVIRNDSANGSISAGIRGIRTIAEWREGTADFDDNQIDGARGIVGVFAKGVKEMSILSPGDNPVTIDSGMAARVSAVAEQFQSDIHHAWTSVRGELNQVTVSGRVSKFRIKQQRDGREIGCSFPPEMLDSIRSSIPSRVEVHGRARYNLTGEITSMQVEDFRVLPSKDHPIEHFTGIDITGGMDAVEYVEKLRSGG